MLIFVFSMKQPQQKCSLFFVRLSGNSTVFINKHCLYVHLCCLAVQWKKLAVNC